MGYVNPERSPTAGTVLAMVGSGHRAFKGLLKDKSPLKMISYGVVKYSNLAQAREVLSGPMKSPDLGVVVRI